MPRDSDASELLDLREMAKRYERRRARDEDATPMEMIDASSVLIARPREAPRGPTWSLAAALAALAFALGIVATLGALRFLGDDGETRAAVAEPEAPAVAVEEPATVPRRAAAPAAERIVPDPAPAPVAAVAPQATSGEDEATAAEPASAIANRAEPAPAPAHRPAANRERTPTAATRVVVADDASDREPAASPDGPVASPDEPPAAEVATAPAVASCTEVDCLLDPSLDCCPSSTEAADEPAPAEDSEPAPELRDSPTAGELQAAMAPLKNGVWTCADRHDIDGVVNVRLSVAPDGGITPTITRGPDAFKQCVGKLIRRVRLARSKNGLAGAYPFVIR